MRTALCALAMTGVFLGGPSAHATPVVYTDEASFQDALGFGASLTVEGFNAVAPGGYASLTLGPMTVHNQFILTVSNNPLYVTEGTIGIPMAGAISPYSFEFAAPINAFAIDLKGLGANIDPGFFLRFEARVDGVQVVQWDLTTGGVMDVRFLGLIDPASSFSSVEFTDIVLWANPPCPVDCFRFPPDIGLDRVQYGQVPEPATAILIALGLLGISGWRRVHA